MLSHTTIIAVKEVAISTIIGKYITLKKHGVNYTAPCPFHNEKSASFTVNDIKNIYKCFGCGTSGDGIKYVMETQNMDFIQAVETIAGIAGIAIEMDASFDNETYQAKKQQRQSMSEVLETVIATYKKNLYELPDTDQVMQYLTGRCITKEIIIEWNLGWATTNWRHITPGLITAGHHDHAAAMGLIKKGKADDSNYDGYRSRIIIPITDQYGQNIGIGGRYIQIDAVDAGKEYPKYINPTENELYNKSAVLFGLNRAAKDIKETGFAWLVEGYFGVIQMHAYGDINTVATCGTALTPAQAQLIKKYTNHIILLRDNDAAGHKALQRDIPTLIKAGLKVDVGQLPDGFNDPDDLIQSLNKT